MKTDASVSRLLFGTLLAGAFLAGCDTNQDTYRDTVNKQNDAFTQGRKQELGTAAKEDSSTTYKGSMHLLESDQDFDCVIELKTTTDLVRITQGMDQTGVIEVPKLTGGMRFPVLDNVSLIDSASYASLTRPMAGFKTVIFDLGNYNPRTNRMYLPYSVQGYSSSSLGEMQGALVNGHYTGTWFSKPFGDVGTFDLVVVSAGGANNADQ